MALESMIFPLPSELVMPFAGFLIAEGRFTWQGVVLFSTLGSIVGSLLSYYIGMYGGKPFLNRYVKYFFIRKKELEWTEKFFKRRGSLTIFISRFIPVVRHMISIP
ncbi:MAG: DedA family protein, partial [Candidatus Pacearchaeota archaeon]